MSMGEFEEKWRAWTQSDEAQALVQSAREGMVTEDVALDVDGDFQVRIRNGAVVAVHAMPIDFALWLVDTWLAATDDNSDSAQGELIEFLNLYVAGIGGALFGTEE